MTEAALREKIKDLEAQLADAKDACPLLVAKKGDLFEHNRSDSMTWEIGPDIFEFIGRTKVEVTAPCKKGFCPCWNSKANKNGHKTPVGWIILKHVKGSGCGISGNHGAVNGGVRDAIGAWPIADYCVFKNSDGDYDEDVFCLPPSKCGGFRIAKQMDEGDY